MHVLLTTDAVGGVWTFTEELSAGLLRRGHQVTLVSMGRALDAGQRASVAALRSPLFQCVETEYRLEWMEDASRDVERAADFLRDLAERLQADVLHTNQFAFGTLSDTLPVLLTGHSCVLSWWEAVHSERIPDTGRMRAYTAMVRAGLLTATELAAPTAWMARELRQQYGLDRRIEVIPNGRSPELFLPGRAKQMQAITAGRAWDPGKYMILLEEIDVDLPLLVAGDPTAPGENGPGPGHSLRGVHYLGKQEPEALRELYSRTALYIATSCYEPFGLAPLEAALSGCALVLSGIPTLREVWDDAAVYFTPRDGHSLEEVVRHLAAHPEEAAALGARALERARRLYSADAMVSRHEALYQGLMPQMAVA